MCYNEEWRDIKGYEGLYQISNFGNIKSLNFNKTNQQRILTLKKSTAGYYQIILYQKNKATNKYIHRLVAETFIPNPENKKQVNHKNRHKNR